MKYIVLLLLLLPLQIISAQNENVIYAGLELNANLLYEIDNGNSRYEMLPLPDVYLHAGYGVGMNMYIDAAAGAIIRADNWNGYDLGLSLKSGLTNQIYTSLGINYYSVNGAGETGSQSPIYYKKNFVFLSLGVGYFVYKGAFVEFDYSAPISRNKLYGFNPVTKSVLELSSRLKLGVGWNFYF